MLTVYEFRYQELYDCKSFTTSHDAGKYKLTRIRENDQYYESDMSKYVSGLNFVIE